MLRLFRGNEREKRKKEDSFWCIEWCQTMKQQRRVFFRELLDIEASHRWFSFFFYICSSRMHGIKSVSLVSFPFSNDECVGWQRPKLNEKCICIERQDRQPPRHRMHYGYSVDIAHTFWESKLQFDEFIIACKCTHDFFSFEIRSRLELISRSHFIWIWFYSLYNCNQFPISAFANV